jgi:hypothetical protein
MGELPDLPMRRPGTHLPPAAYLVIGIARVPQENEDGIRFSDDAETINELLHHLRCWEVGSR